MTHYVTRTSTCHGACVRRGQRGLSLIEFMVSITIGLVLVAGLTLLFSQQSQTQVELEKSSRQIENGRYAMQLLREDLQLAGYYGEFFRTDLLAVPAALPGACVTTAAELEAAMIFPVQGYDAPAGALPPSMASCPLDPANHLAGTDILVVRHTETTPLTSGLTPGLPYLQVGMFPPAKLEMRQTLALATSNAIDTSVFKQVKLDDSTAPVRAYAVHIYFVSPCSVPANGATCSPANNDDGGVSVPTLKRMELTAAGGVPTYTTVPLVEGIENMQVDYGFDNSGDGVPDGNYVGDALAIGDWANAMAVRVHLLARNNERTPGYRDDKSYDLGSMGATLPTNDNFKRHVFTQTIRLVNPSARRER